MAKQISLLAMLLGLPTSVLHAHPTWFAGDVQHHGETADIVLELTTSHHFPKFENAVPLERLQRTSVVTKDAAAPLLLKSQSRDHLQLRSKISAQTSVWAIAETKASAIELDAETVAVYLTELGQPKGVAQRYKKTQQWREHYSKHAKVWVQLGAQAANEFMMKPLQLAYELVPTQDLSRVAPKQMFSFCAYAQGKPVAGAFISLSNNKGQHESRYADERGCADFKRPKGDFLAHSILIKPNTEPNWDWRSHFATLTYISAIQTPDSASLAPPSTHPKASP
jgi:uncharacterized GH25 family protein